MNTPLLSFNGGELTPLLRHRTDFAKHQSGAERMENFLPLPHGGIVRRPGTRYISTLPTIPANSAAFPFIASDGIRYIIIATPGTLLVIGALDGIVKASIPFLDSLADASLTQLAQINDVAYLTHPAIAPCVISTTGDTGWDLEFLTYSAPPVRPQNLNELRQITVLGNPIATNWSTATAYTAGNVRRDGDAEFVCIVNHTSDANNRPTGSTGLQFWNRKLYQANDPVTLLTDITTSGPAWDGATGRTSYVIGDVIRIDPATYASFSNPPPPHPFNPGVPANWICKANHNDLDSADQFVDFNTKWTAIEAFTTFRTWFLNHYLSRAGNLYKVKVASTTRIPGITSGWESHWDQIIGANLSVNWVYPTYSKGDIVEGSTPDTFFIARTDHLANLDSEPTTGAQYIKFWQENNNAIFQSAHAETPGTCPGTYFQISTNRATADFQVQIAAITANNGVASRPIAVLGTWSLNTFGVWHGTFTVERSIDNGVSYLPIASYESTGDRNIAIAREEETAALLRIRFASTASTAASGNQRAVLTPELPGIRSHVLVDTFIDETKVTGIASAPILSGKTFNWAEGAFSCFRGFPQAIAFHDSRLVLAGTISQPTSLWFSAVDQYSNFLYGSNASDALTVSLTTGAQNRIRWLASQRRLFIGTATEEWILGGDENERPVTPSSILARQYTNFGSAHRPPAPLADSFVFLGRNQARIREIAYVDERQAYSAPELTRLADHLTAAGITSLAWQQVSEPALWATTGDGLLLHFAFNREDLITAWSRHSTQDGQFLHAIVFPGQIDDDVLLITTRTITPTPTESEPNPTPVPVNILEAIPANWSTQIENPSDPYPFPLDCQINTTQEIFTLPNALGGTILNTTTAGSPLTPVTPAGGQLTLGPGTHHIGFPVTSTLTTLPLDIGTSQPDGTHARRKRLHAINLNLISTGGASITYAGNTPEPLRLPTQPFTGWHELALPPAHTQDATFTITHQHQTNFILLAAALRWNQTESKA